MTGAPINETAKDACDELNAQNELILDMLEIWDRKTEQLEGRDDVDDRWERGSAGKLLLQHLAVRETAIADITDRLKDVGQPDLAATLEGGGVERRRAIDELDETVRGLQAMNMNNPATVAALENIAQIVRLEIGDNARDLEAVRAALGPSGERGLPGARSVRVRADTHPSPERKWYENIKPLKALVAFYDHLRSSPQGMTAPNVDRGREHMPGPWS